jgi:hypothetical protein
MEEKEEEEGGLRERVRVREWVINHTPHTTSTHRKM